VSGRRLLVGIRIDGTVAAEPRQVGAEVLAAERRGLNFVLFGDAPGTPARWNLDPIECAFFTSATTRAIGLIATAAVTHAEPFHLSNRLSGLDWGSSGRAGWLAAVDASAARGRILGGGAGSAHRAA
jgi:alkanesulfonate monooxygenase SsuD/methylene tetrahydromethanopterin reductase-like flavin-dependent oxidoreductase (luciferase family)